MIMIRTTILEKNLPILTMIMKLTMKLMKVNTMRTELKKKIEGEKQTLAQLAQQQKQPQPSQLQDQSQKPQV